MSTAFSRNMPISTHLFVKSWLLLGAALFLGAATVSPVGAQQQAPGASPFNQGIADPNARIIMPWEKNLQKFLRRQNLALPSTTTDRVLRRLNRDPMARLGYEANRPPPSAPQSTVPVGPTFEPGVSQLDTNLDGSVSRDEYFRGRDRRFAIGDKSPTRRRVYLQKLDSRFGYADQDGNGKVSPEELSTVPGARF